MNMIARCEKGSADRAGNSVVMDCLFSLCPFAFLAVTDLALVVRRPDLPAKESMSEVM